MGIEVSHKLWYSHYLYLISLGNPNLLLCARTVVLVAEKEEVEAGTSSHRFSPVGSPSVMGSKWRKGKGKRRTLLEGELP